MIDRVGGRDAHTGVMAARNTLSTRWVTVIMVVALACSVVVVWGLIQITGQSPASSSTPSAGAPASDSGRPTEPSGPSSTDAVGSPTLTADPSAAEGSRSRGTDISTAVTTAPALPGTGLQLPAAWTGTAEMTITVLGRCAATGGTSSYTRTADLALQGPVLGAGPIDDPNPLSITLGITPAEIPGLTIYSASTGRSGDAQRWWWLTTGADAGPAGEGRTMISGVLINDQPVSGVLPPNLLVDNETDLQPCESGGTVRVPRTLAAGSRLTGWVTATQGHLDVLATTADGERTVTAVVELTRKPAA
jgi:hypothetical protein